MARITDTLDRAPRYLTATEVARLLGLSVLYVYQHGIELGGQRFGARWRFPTNRLPGQADATWVAPKLGRPRKHARPDSD